jgi:hypothetical protein
MNYVSNTNNLQIKSENQFHFTQDQIDIIRLISKLFSCLSMSGSILVMIIFWFFKENRSINLELVLWYSLSNFLYSITAFFPFDPENQKVWCHIQAIFLTWFQEACQLWTCIIGYVAFISVIKKNHIENNKLRYRVIFLIIAFVVSGCLASM